jgi:phage repressor protein C with HTH and peptisase S24 domain/DNA-binding Xre family transcriptional regulator
MTNRIRDVRKSRHVTLEELADLTGISTSYLSRIESNGRGLSLENAVKIARQLGCDVEDITDEYTTDDIASAEKVTPASGSPTETKGDIPNLTIHAGMGIGRAEYIEGADSGFVPDQFTEGYWTFPEPVRERFRHIAMTHALPVLGDSMEPTLRDGAIVFVDTTHTVPSPPDLYAVDYGDGLMVKRIELIPKTKRVRVISDNDKHYKVYELDRDDLHVFGRVVASFQWRG